MKISQLVRHYNPDSYIYTENGSKNRSGGLWQLQVENKVVPIFANGDLGVRCHVRLLDEYISKLPPKAFEMDAFYMKPLDKPLPSKPGFAAQPCGENKLACMVKDMFAMAGITGKTNHSLRATGASELFRSSVPEKIVQERTGHRSIKALRMYERTTQSQHMAVSPILSSDTDMGFEEAHSDVKKSNFQPGVGFSLSSLIGQASHCVINVNFAQAGETTVNFGDSDYDFPSDIERACNEMDM